jgi:integrase
MKIQERPSLWPGIIPAAARWYSVSTLMRRYLAASSAPHVAGSLVSGSGRDVPSFSSSSEGWSGRDVRSSVGRSSEVRSGQRAFSSTNRCTSKRRSTEIRTIDRFDRVFGQLLQDSLTQQHLYKYIDERVDEREEFKHLNKPAPSAARHDVRFLKKMLVKGIRWGAGTTNAAVNIEMDSDTASTRDVTPEQYDAVYRLANTRVQIVMDLADIIGQRRGDILGIQPARDFTDEGILILQGKTQKPLLIEWTDALRAIIDRALALKPDIPKQYLIRNLQGQRYTPRGFGAMWQKLMRKVTRPGKNGAPPILAERFKFRDLRRKAATAKAIATTEEEAQDLLAHSDIKTTRKHYLGAGTRKPKKVRPVR